MTRGEAINWLINISADIGKAEHRDLWHYEQTLGEIKEMLEGEQEPRWIPCSERLPEEDGNYLIWYRYKRVLGGFQEAMDMEYYADSTGWDCDNVKVIAWHPLPEPYKGAKMEDNDGE